MSLSDFFNDPEQAVCEPSADIEVDEFTSQMQEAELRLKKASYYRTLLDGELFSDSDEVTAEITQEIQRFVKTRMFALINVSQDEDQIAKLFSTQEVENLKAVAAAFGEREVAALRALAAKVLSSPKVLGPDVSIPPASSKPATPPALRQRSVQQSKPAVNKRASVPVKPTASPAKPTASKPLANPLKPAVNPAKPAVSKPKVKATPAAEVKIPKNGEIIQDGKKRYKIAWSEVPDEYEPPQGVGKIVQNGKTYKVVRMDITPQERPIDAVPMPSIHAMSIITANQASEASRLVPDTMIGISQQNKGHD